ncbi:MAG: hypothetical protein R3F49_06800 [Planctomycetota bacterium]
MSFPQDMTGKNLVGISTGWAFVEAEADLSNGTGPLANPLLGGSDVGSSTTDLQPVFGIGLKYLKFLDNNWSFGGILEHRRFDPDSTRPLNADLDIDEFGTNHLILDLRYWFNPLDRENRFRPFAAVQFGYVPEINADGVVRYAAIPSLGLPAVTEDIKLEGDEFFTLGFLVGGSYLIQKDLTFDFGAFYEIALDPSEDTISLQPHPGQPVIGAASTYDGELLEKGLYLTFGLSYTF